MRSGRPADPSIPYIARGRGEEDSYSGVFLTLLTSRDARDECVQLGDEGVIGAGLDRQIHELTRGCALCAGEVKLHDIGGLKHDGEVAKITRDQLALSGGEDRK